MVEKDLTKQRTREDVPHPEDNRGKDVVLESVRSLEGKKPAGVGVKD